MLFTSEDAHYSVRKLASFLGLGTDNVYLVNADGRGKMDPCHLEELIEKAIKEGTSRLTYHIREWDSEGGFQRWGRVK